jgi:hypothetical protein
MPELVLQAGERRAVGRCGGDGETAPDQGLRRLVVVNGRLLPRRFEVGSGGGRIFGAVEVLGVQHRVAAREPVRHPPVQGAAAGLEEAVVDRVPDQGVGEQQAVALGAHQDLFDQRPAAVVGALEQIAQALEREALAEHRGRQQSLLVGGIEVVQPCLDQALHRARHAPFGARLGMA